MPKHYLFLFLRYSWLVILIVAGTLAGTYAWLNQQAPVYEARAVLEIETEQSKVVDIEDVKENRVTGLDAVNTVIQTLTSNDIMLAVARADGRAEAWAAQEPTGKLPAERQSALAASVRNQLKVSLRRGTRLIDIVAEDFNADKARTLAGLVVQEFFAMQLKARSGVSGDANEFLVKEAKKLKDQLEESEGRLAKYRLDNKSVSVNEKQNIVVERLNALNTQVTQANAQRATIESDLAALKGIKPQDTEGMLKLASVAALPEVAQLRLALTTKEGDFAKIRERYLELHPKYGAAQSELSELRAKLKTAAANAGDTLRQQYKTFAGIEEKLEAMLKEQEAKALELDQVAIPYNALLRDVQTDRVLYETILTRLKETTVTQGLTKTPYRIAEEPLINPLPVRPNKPKILLIATFLALAGGVGLVLLLDRLDSSIRTVDDAERELGLPVLAVVPEADLSKLPKGGSFVTEDSNSSQAESFRTLRASLSLLGEEDQRRIILVTSAIPSEGKTFTAHNLAASLATQGLRTLIIDGDLRRPALSSLLLEPNERKGTEFRGLTDVLSNLCATKEAVRPTAIHNLDLLPSGRRAPNPAELLAQPNVIALINQFAWEYDRVVIDSPPVNAVSDSLTLAPHMHAVVLVLRSSKTPRRAIMRAITLLQKAGARMAGLVMNRMATRSGAAYYYYYYGDSYVNDTVYSGDDKKGQKNRKRSKAGKVGKG